LQEVKRIGRSIGTGGERGWGWGRVDVSETLSCFVSSSSIRRGGRDVSGVVEAEGHGAGYIAKAWAAGVSEQERFNVVCGRRFARVVAGFVCAGRIGGSGCHGVVGGGIEGSVGFKIGIDGGFFWDGVGCAIVIWYRRVGSAASAATSWARKWAGEVG
jgi:hypothetical protein